MALTNAIGNATESAIMKLIFQAVAWADYAINHTTTPQTQIGMSLHTADPGEAGDASTTEVAYTGYTRVNVARTTGGWAEASGAITPVANIDFPASSSAGGTATYCAAAKSNATPPTGAQAILWRGDVTPSIACTSGVTPRLTTATTFSLE